MSDPNFTDGAPPLDPGAFGGMDESAPEPVTARAAPRKKWWLVAAGVVVLAAVAVAVASYKVLSEPPPKPPQPENVPGDEPKPKPPPKVGPPAPPTPKDEGPSAIRFTGPRAHVKFPTLVASDTKPLTIEAWLLNEPAEFRMFLKTKTGVWVLARTADPAAAYQLTHFAGSEGTVRTFDTTAPAKKWSHVAVVVIDDQPTLFVDGKPLTAKPAPMTRDKAAPQWASAVGNVFLAPASDETAGGTVAGLRVSQSARYAKEFRPPLVFDADKDTLALYRFAEGKGEATQDLSGNNHIGQLAEAMLAKLKPEDGDPAGPPKK